MPFYLFILFIGCLLFKANLVHASNAKCYDQDVMNYFYTLSTSVENAHLVFTVPKSLNGGSIWPFSDSQKRLFGEPYLWERNNLWVQSTRQARFEAALIDIATLL